MSYWGWRQSYPKSRPRAAKGGIKAQSKRGRFAESWWAQRWIAVLESFDIGARLSRGRSYARNGQVLSIDIDRGVVKATVQGSRPKPYAISIAVKQLSKADWKKLAQTLAGQAIYAAKLLAGEIPQDIEKLFADADLSLFPRRLDDLATKCSCPDWSNPCKHIAAVYYLLGEEFDRDPFLIFKLRGLSRDELVKLISERPGLPRPSAANGKSATRTPASAAPLAEPLSPRLPDFWQGGELPENLSENVSVAPTPAGLPRRLGNFPFWRGEAPFLSALAPVYAAAARRGLAVFVGESASSARG